MPIVIQGTGTSTKPVLIEPTLPANTLVPSRREAVEALGHIQRLATQHDHAVLVDGSTITWDQCFDTVRRFVLTR